jgi:hypothetical protein
MTARGVRKYIMFNVPPQQTIQHLTISSTMSQPGDKFTKSTTAQEVVEAFPKNIKGRYSEATALLVTLTLSCSNWCQPRWSGT